MQSVLLHGAVIGALAYGVYAYKTKPRPAPTLAIEGSIVESKDVKNTPPKAAEALPKPPEREPAPPPEDQGPPTPSPAEIEQQKREAEEAIRQADEDRQAQERKQADEHAAAEKAAAEQKVREEADRKKREQDAEAKKVAEAKKRAEDQRKAEDAKRASEREADLRKSLEAEEHVAALRSSGAQIQWQQQIANRINANWNRSSKERRPGVSCVLYLTQVPGGVITNVKVGDCDVNAAARQAIENAVYASSPLPPPPDQALFDRNLTLTFKLD